MKYITFFLIAFFTFKSFSQDLNQREALENIMSYNAKEFSERNTYGDSRINDLINWNIDAMKFGVNDSLTNHSSYTSKFAKILNKIRNADILLNQKSPKDSLAFVEYRNALDLSIKETDTILISFILQKILEYAFNNRELTNVLDDYLKKYSNYLTTNNDTLIFNYYRYTLDSYFQNTSGIKNLKSVIPISKRTKNRYFEGRLNQMIGIHFSHFENNRDSARKYYNKAYKIYDQIDIEKANYSKFGITLNLGIENKEEKKYGVAIDSFKSAEKIKLHNNAFIKKLKLYESLSDTYRIMKLYDSSLYYLDLEKIERKKLNEYNLARSISESNIKYETEKKEKENLQLKADNLQIEAKRKQNRNLLIGSISLLLFGIITFFLIQKNTKRKQLLAEQEKELQVQKVGTLMKEQELASIDAMIAGQEKERQRIANDLHDDLGGMMATVKLHFNTLKDKPSTALYNKTDKLLEEAYQKVRTIAHTKNSGVIAKEGLLKSVKNMAQKVSYSGKITIDVLDHGLENRLENSLELTIFRIIQELITNIIKHANATEATIHLTQHDESLNIMVEDNGKGFDTKQLSKKNGMGLGSIDKRVDYLNGNLEIDSEIGRGTNIIIDIPI